MSLSCLFGELSYVKYFREIVIVESLQMENKVLLLLIEYLELEFLI